MKIAIIGTGLMGTAMAEALMSVGHEIIAYNELLPPNFRTLERSNFRTSSRCL